LREVQDFLVALLQLEDWLDSIQEQLHLIHTQAEMHMQTEVSGVREEMVETVERVVVAL
jgi:hypothetical protein